MIIYFHSSHQVSLFSRTVKKNDVTKYYPYDHKKYNAPHSTLFCLFFFYFTINNISELNIAWFSDSPSCSQEMMWQNIIHMITKNIMALIQHFFFPFISPLIRFQNRQSKLLSERLVTSNLDCLRNGLN